MKRLLAIVLTVSISLAICALAAKYVPSDWAKAEVLAAESAGIAKDSYDYQAPISREDFCGLIYNYLDVLNTEFSYDNNKFTDTENEKIIALCNLGIVNGRAEDKFAPDATLTREEAATVLARVVQTAHPLIATGMTGNWIQFYDEAEFSPWAKFNIQNMYKYGIMGGVGREEITISVNGGSESVTTWPVFDPKGTFTAEQAIATVYRLYIMTKEEMKINDGTFADRLNETMPSNENYMFSPLSVKMALLLAANGADGETKLEILNTVGVEDLDAYNSEVKDLIAKYSQSELLTLKVSNSIWMNKSKSDMEFSDTYKELIADIFGGSAESVTDSDAVKRINLWVNDSTNGKIPTIVNNSDFWACLVNAVYFKGRWVNEFHPAATRKDTFFTRDNERRTIDFMNKTAWMQVADAGDVTIVELPYLTREDKFDEDGQYIDTVILDNMDVSMYLMMSEGDFSPEKVLKNAEMSSAYVALSVPKFKIEYETELNSTLKSLGINLAFLPAADFTKMFESGNMWIDNTIHKTYISIDEEGTEAAAVTLGGMAGSGLPPEPREIKFNKPFTFVIKDNVSGEILFMGEYAY